MKYVLWLLLYTYGLLFHITSSEFWPITISKTWFTPVVFEHSMLQKPLLTLFLSGFHLLPLNDVIHIFLVKTVFSVFGVMALTYFGHFILEISKFEVKNLPKSDVAALIAFTLVCISPVIRSNFFNVRSDQVAFLFFSFFLLFCLRRQLWAALVTLVLIPCLGIKEIVFLLPGIYFFYQSFRSFFTPKIIFYTSMSALTVLVWIVALNMHSAFYLLQNFESAQYVNRFGPLGFQSETTLLVFSMASIVFILLKKLTHLYSLIWLAALSMFAILALPQANSFFIASMIPIVFLPLLALFFDRPWFRVKVAVVAISLLWSTSFTAFYKIPWHHSNLDQLWFIEMASKVVESNKLTYLDGQGILPRQKFIPCFVSPDDDLANNACWERLQNKEPEALIITNRLFFLGEEVFRIAEGHYTQIYPNFWILNEKMNDSLRGKIDLGSGKPLPVIIF